MEDVRALLKPRTRDEGATQRTAPHLHRGSKMLELQTKMLDLVNMDLEHMRLLTAAYSMRITGYGGLQRPEWLDIDEVGPPEVTNELSALVENMIRESAVTQRTMW